MSRIERVALRPDTALSAADASAEAATAILRMLTSSPLDLGSQADLDDRELLAVFARL